VEHHVRLVGLLNIAVGVLSGLIAIFQMAFFGGALTIAVYLSIHTQVVSVWLWLMLLLMIPSIVIGLALFGLRGWSRGAGIVLSIFQLVNLPLGTVVAFYSLWVLFSEETDMIFNRRYGQYVVGRR
jgi:ethanolamine transporter EutH